MNKIKIFFLLVFIFCSSCNKEKQKFSPEIVEIISNENPKYPSVFATVLFFGKTKNDEIIILYVQELRRIHKMKYKTLDFRDFVDSVFNEKITIDCQDESYCFGIDPHVEDIYINKSFDDFKKKFCDISDSKIIMLKKNISKKQFNSINYFFFRNNYLSYFDDNTGRWYFISTTDVIKNLGSVSD
ncbi:hypothetical protein [Flavobacterium notoginsengisoli]|uniref:hypothetical protein n=1 Tax=Flavobacterium notoginsengisoli TaxID=1478199 RepID=UPI0036391852